MKIISLGYKCNTAEWLLKNDLRCESLPFDWVITKSLDTINAIINDTAILDNYATDIVDKTNNKISTIFGAGKDVKNLMHFCNIYQGLIFRHVNVLNESAKATAIKRMKRFISYLQSSERILFIRHLHNNNINTRLKRVGIDDNNRLSDTRGLNQAINSFFNILKEKYNRTNDILIIVTEMNMKPIEHNNVVWCRGSYRNNKFSERLLNAVNSYINEDIQ